MITKNDALFENQPIDYFEWEVKFPEEYLGLNFRHIPKEKIPFYEILKDRDCIKNTNGYKLLYFEEDNAFRIPTNNPNDFLPIDQVCTKWEIMSKGNIIVYDVIRDSSMYFNSPSDAAKHLDVKVDRILKVIDSDTMIHNAYLIRRSN